MHLLSDCPKSSPVARDVGFALDISGSVSSLNWENEKTFTKSLSSLLGISESGGHVSLLRFDSSAFLDITFNDYSTYDEFSNSVDQLGKNHYGTDIYGALRTGLDEMFTSENGIRSHASKMMSHIVEQNEYRKIRWIFIFLQSM